MRYVSAWRFFAREMKLTELCLVEHCRRRKIRCIVEAPDKTGPCVNCVRLKKNCSFHSVDQPPASENRSKASSRASTGPKVASASSSPAPASTISSTTSGAANQQFQGLAIATPHQVPQLSSDGELDPDMYAQNTKSKDTSNLPSSAHDRSSMR